MVRLQLRWQLNLIAQNVWIRFSLGLSPSHQAAPPSQMIVTNPRGRRTEALVLLNTCEAYQLIVLHHSTNRNTLGEQRHSLSLAYVSSQKPMISSYCYNWQGADSMPRPPKEDFKRELLFSWTWNSIIFSINSRCSHSPERSERPEKAQHSQNTQNAVPPGRGQRHQDVHDGHKHQQPV